MKPKHIQFLMVLALIESGLALIWVIVIPASVNRSRLLPHPLMQGLATALIAILILIGALILFRLKRDFAWGERFAAALDRWLTHQARVIMIKDVVVIGLIFAIEWTLLTYLSIPIAFRPVLVLTALLLVQVWILLAQVYPDQFRAHPGGWAGLRAQWHGLEESQRRTFKLLLVIAVIYFGLFAFINWHGLSENAATFFSSSGDEVVLYPVATKMVSAAPDLAGQVYRFLIHEDYHYGYPYYYFNALILAGSRLVFGPGFVNQTQINLFLLRQIVSVLPLIGALLILVYLVTRFRSALYSSYMFIVLLSIPGLIRYNQQFWHPDALQMLFVALTFYYLQRDQLRFGRDFYYAAAMCGLAAATKLYGFFFFLVIAVYLFTGLMKNYLTFKHMLQAGAGFVLVLAMTLLFASPFLLVPSAQKSLTAIVNEKSVVFSQGDNQPDPEGVYVKGLGNWLRYFEYYYGKPIFFFFAFGALALGSFVGGQKSLNQELFLWSVVVAAFLIYYVAVKPYHYMIPLALPLYAGAFAFPSLLQETDSLIMQRLLSLRMARWIVWGLTSAIVGSQFIFNVWDIFTSPYIRVAF